MRLKSRVGSGVLLLITVAIAQERNEMAPPSGWETWNITDSCSSAREIFDFKNKPQAVTALYLSEWAAFEGKTPVQVKRRVGGCAEITVVGGDAEGSSGWIAADLLLKLSPEQVRRAADAKARAAMLATLPVVDSGSPAVFFGADRKCSEQFVQALSMEGLEKRKKLAELVTFGCGFTDTGRLRVKRAETQGGFCRVIPMEGKHQGSAGWAGSVRIGRIPALQVFCEHSGRL